MSHPTSLILPLLTLVGVSVGWTARQVRAGMVEVMRRDYVMVARLAGVPERRVLRRYALRNGLATSVQVLAQTAQYLLGGIIVVEVLFSYPGIGNLLVQSVQSRDTTVVQAVALLIAAAYIAINIAADVAVVFLVPKLRTEMLCDRDRHRCHHPLGSTRLRWPRFARTWAGAIGLAMVGIRGCCRGAWTA